MNILISRCLLSDTFGPMSVHLKSFINNTLIVFEIWWKEAAHEFIHS